MNGKRSVLYIVLFLIANDLYAQTETGTISGKIIDGSKPLETATVGLYTGKDSLLAKTTLAGVDGSFVFDRLKYGNYYIVASMAGFNRYKTGEILLNPDHSLLALDPFVLSRQEAVLQNVTVTAQKPMIERKVDRTVVNVDAMISAAGSTAMDVLEKSPGVSIDQNGVISLKGRSGVTIFIDDKPTYLSGADLESYLRSLPASTIDQIELMTNPPAKYDAAGGAGVINIRIKRSRVRGFNGSVNAAYTQGRYGKTNNSFNFNYRNNKWNSFGTLTYNSANNFSDLDIDRHFKNPDGSRKYDFLQHTYIRPTANAFSAKLGADYYATTKTTFGIVLTGIARTGKGNNDNESKILNAAFQLDSTIVAHNRQDNSFRNGGINFNYRHQYAKGGPELTSDLDYIRYSSDNDQVFNNYTYLPNGTLANQDRLNGSLPAKINILSGKIDYSHPFKKGWKAETGIKSSRTETDNVADYYYHEQQYDAGL